MIHASSDRQGNEWTPAGIVDVHSHVLPSIDDGPENVDEATALLSALSGQGVVRIVATPHVSSRFPNPAEAIHAAVARLAVPDGISVEAGAEVHPDRLEAVLAEGAQAYSLAASGVLLLEVYPGIPVDLLEAAIRRTHRAGLRVLLGHPERCADLQRHPAALAPMVESGAMVQITGRSLLGDSRPSERLAWQLLDLQLVHVVASDAHALQTRRPAVGDVADALARRYGAAAPEQLLVQNPTRMLAGQEPEAPEVAAGAHRRHRRFGRRQRG